MIAVYIKSVLNVALSVLQYSVIIECLASWIPGVSQYRVFEIIRKINAPFLDPIRKLLMNMTSGMPLDLSPVILFMIIGLVRKLLWKI